MWSSRSDPHGQHPSRQMFPYPALQSRRGPVYLADSVVCWWLGNGVKSSLPNYVHSEQFRMIHDKMEETKLHRHNVNLMLQQNQPKGDIARTLDSIATSAKQLSLTDSASDSRVLSSIPNSISSPLPILSGWNCLPLECLEVIVEILDDDTSTLAALLQVDRQCFFLVVRRLYTDPFQRIRDLSRIKSNSISLASSTIPDSPLAAYFTSMDRFDRDLANISTILTTQLKARERALITTLFSTLVQQLCVRFPRLHSHFYQLPFDQYYGHMKSGPFGFGPYHRQITWTSRYYLRYHTVIDLEKLCTRKRSNLDGTFQELFSPYRWSSMNSIGILDYLQRALLNQPGADRIQSLRIPIHRMRTFQQRHERAPRNRKKSRTEEGRNRRETQAANHSLEKGGPEITPQADGVEDSGNKSGNNINPPIFSSVTDESQRPYCFTFNKLTNLRRLDVFWMTDNQCDWEALDRVLATLLFGNHRGIAGAIEGKDNGERKENYQLLNQIREFSLHTQSALGAPFHKILNYFEHLEVLELQSDSYQHNPWVSHWNPALCRDLKVLRMGTSALWNGTSTAFEDLGRLESLEELRITINNPLHFQWVVDAKMKLARCGRKESINPNSSQPGYSIAPGNKTTTYVNINESYPLSNCLPNLKKLGCTLTGNRCQLSLRNITEAFSDQLEEFVLRSNYRNNAIHRIEHPFRHLCRLAIRGDILLRFDFASLAQNCPTVELLAIQHSCYTRVIADILEKNAAVAALVSLKKLRCLYLEGTWYFNSEQFLRLAQESVSLYKIAFYRCDSITSTALKMADEILSCRHSKYPLKPKGVFRLPSTMSDVLARDISWRTTFFGHDDD